MADIGGMGESQPLKPQIAPYRNALLDAFLDAFLGAFTRPFAPPAGTMPAIAAASFARPQ